MRGRRFVIAAATFVLLSGIGAKVLAQGQESPRHEERAKAVALVRVINTAEAWYKQGTKTKNGAVDSHGRYASWEELNNSGTLQLVQSAMMQQLEISAGPEVMQGYHLDLLVSADGQSYSLALHDTRKGDGLFSVFSDQNGLIFVGSPI